MSHPAPDDELRVLADRLAGHPDYRVLRRLRPREQFSDLPARRVRRALVIDTETTGADARNDLLVEIGMIAFEYDADDGRVLRITEELDALEDPGIPIPPQATAIHRITDDMVAGQRIDDAAVEALARSAQVVIAHNAAFDRAVCERRFPFFAELPWACSWSQIDWRAEGFLATKLELLALESGFFYDAHRASTDCRVLLELLSRPLPASGHTGLAQLLENARRPELRLWTLGAPIEKKDLLKARGYRWSPGEHGKPKAWHRALPESELEPELAWLREAVYGGRPATLRADRQDAACRFSDRIAATLEIAL